MTDNEFWEIVEESRGATGAKSQSEQKAILKKALSKLEVAEVESFNKIFVQMVHTAYTWDLWGAAYIINGGCSDDSFEYFRRGLIAAGRQRFDEALRDPESLGDWVEPDALEFEDINYVIYDVYKEKTGLRTLPKHGLTFPANPSGEPWEEDGDDLETRFPKLWAKFGA